jgi:hypothetical protein
LFATEYTSLVERRFAMKVSEREWMVRQARALLQGACMMRRFRGAQANAMFWQAMRAASEFRRRAMGMAAC